MPASVCHVAYASYYSTSSHFATTIHQLWREKTVTGERRGETQYHSDRREKGHGTD